MDSILQVVEGIICYIDDILVTGTTDKEHLDRLQEVLKCLQGTGLKLKKEKCVFLQKSVEYMIDLEDLRPLPGKLEAIVKAPEPSNIQQLNHWSLISIWKHMGDDSTNAIS